MIKNNSINNNFKNEKTMSTDLKEQTVELVNTDNFDWEEVSNNYIPKYSDLVKELEQPSKGINKFLVNQFKLYQGIDLIEQITKNTTVTGKVISITEKQVTIDICSKDNIVIERRGSEEKICKQLNVGQYVDVLVTDVTDIPYSIKGSLSELVKIKANNTMIESYKSKTSINAFVKEMIAAGYMLEINIDDIRIDAFMPNTLADANKLHDPTSIVGTNIKVMLETLQQDKGIYVVSRKKYLISLIPEKIKEIKSAPRDKVYIGHVTGTREFGIFVQFEDCLTGMIHKANIQEQHQDRIEAIKPGSKIEFYIKDVIKGGQQIILTQKLEDSLWDTIRVGDKLKGNVISVKPFGALISLDYETNGLIQTTYINKNQKTLKAGEVIDVLVISIIRDDRKIYLTFSDDEEMVDKLKDKSTEIDKLKQKYNK